MSFNFSYVFGGLRHFDHASTINQVSPCYDYSDYNWSVEAVLEHCGLAFYLYGESQHSVVRRGIRWKVMFDVTFTISNRIIYLVCQKSFINISIDCRLSGTLLCKLQRNSIQEETVLQNLNMEGGIPITVRISNLRTVGFRKFNPIDFMSQNCIESDVTISIKQEKIHCHSEFLCESSVVFDSIISNMKTKKFQNYSFGLKQGISVDEFLELLHHLYFPTEIIDDDNLRILLHWAKEFEVTPVLAKCEKIMRESLCNSESQVEMNKIIEYLLLSWRYNIEPLQNSYVYTVLEKRGHKAGFNDIMCNQHYHEMDSVRRLKMLELVLESLIFRENDNSWEKHIVYETYALQTHKDSSKADYHNGQEHFAEDFYYQRFGDHQGIDEDDFFQEFDSFYELFNE